MDIRVLALPILLAAGPASAAAVLAPLAPAAKSTSMVDATVAMHLQRQALARSGQVITGAHVFNAGDRQFSFKVEHRAPRPEDAREEYSPVFRRPAADEKARQEAAEHLALRKAALAAAGETVSGATLLNLSGNGEDVFAYLLRFKPR